MAKDGELTTRQMHALLVTKWHELVVSFSTIKKSQDGQQVGLNTVNLLELQMSKKDWTGDM